MTNPFLEHFQNEVLPRIMAAKVVVIDYGSPQAKDQIQAALTEMVERVPKK